LIIGKGGETINRLKEGIFFVIIIVMFTSLSPLLLYFQDQSKLIFTKLEFNLEDIRIKKILKNREEVGEILIIGFFTSMNKIN